MAPGLRASPAGRILVSNSSSSSVDQPRSSTPAQAQAQLYSPLPPGPQPGLPAEGGAAAFQLPAGSHPAVCGTLCRFLPGVGSVSSMSACEAGLDVTLTPFFPPYPLQPFCPNNDSPSCLPVCPASLPSSLPPLPAVGGKLRLQLGQSPWWGQGQGGCGFVFIFILISQIVHGPCRNHGESTHSQRGVFFPT